MLNYTTGSAYVTYALGNRTDISSYVGTWLNMAYRDIWEVMDAHSKEDISTGSLTIAQGYLAIPDGTYQIEQVIVDDTILDKEIWREYNKIEDFPSAKPTKYYVFGTKIYFDTKPDDDYAYEIWRIKNPTDLSGTTSPDFPLYYETPWLARALYYGYQMLQMPQEAASWYQMSLEQLGRIRQQHWKENEDLQRGLRLSPRRRA